MQAADSEREGLYEQKLYAMAGTLRCARQGCVPCRAKLLAATDGASSTPNARPETCLRLATSSHGSSAGAAPTAASSTAPLPREPTSLGLYQRGQRILTIGDGDFSFSLALARALDPSRLVATSYESLETVVHVYGPSCAAAIEEIRRRGARVCHGVDAGDLASTLPHDLVPRGGFDRIVWNFPCVARGEDGEALADAQDGADGRGSVGENRALVARFCAGATAPLAPCGEVHVTHKIGLQQWYIPREGAHATGGELQFAGAVIFDRAAYPPYRPRKAFARKGFPTTDARTFVFVKQWQRKQTPADEDVDDDEDEDVDEAPYGSGTLSCEAGLVQPLEEQDGI